MRQCWALSLFTIKTGQFCFLFSILNCLLSVSSHIEMSTTNLSLVYGVLLYEGMSILDIYTLLEFLNVISLDLPLKIHLISAEASNVVSTKVGQNYITKIKPAFLGGEQRMVADFSLDNAPDVDVIVVPGGTASEEVILDGRVTDFLKARYPVSCFLISDSYRI